MSAKVLTASLMFFTLGGSIVLLRSCEGVLPGDIACPIKYYTVKVYYLDLSP